MFIFIYGLMNYQEIRELAETEIQTYGLVGVLLVSFLLDLFPQYISPHIALISAPLLDFNWIYVFLAVAVGSTLGSMLGFEIGAFSKKKSKLSECIFGEEDCKKIEKSLNNGGKWFISLAAISPLPYIPIILGTIGVKRKTFLFYGILPRVMGFVAFSGLLRLGINLID